MTIMGVILLFLLFGRISLMLPWQGMKTGVWEMLKKGISSGTVAIWESSYPPNRLVEGSYGIGGLETGGGQRTGAGLESKAGQKELPWQIRWILERSPIYSLAAGSGNKVNKYQEEDPSYRKYMQRQEFYQEHEYLFQYGDENTNEGSDPTQNPGQSQGDPVMGEGNGGTETAASGQPSGITQQNPAKNTTPAYTTGITRQVVGTQYVMEQLADYDFLMKHFYNVHSSTTAGRDLMDAGKLLAEDFKLEGTNEKPQILIYHTHSQETYADYGPEHQDGNVVGIGNYLTGLLEQKGYRVIHDKSVYDLRDGKLDRSKAYTYALEGITSILQSNPSIEVILDVHRDGVNEGVHLVNEVNGKQTASIMFFNGTSQTPTGPIEYLSNPYREDNLAFSLQMQLDAAAYFPGLTRKIYLKGLRYNQHLRPRSALIEVGAQTNTTEEAMNAMEPLAELLDMILQGN